MKAFMSSIYANTSRASSLCSTLLAVCVSVFCTSARGLDIPEIPGRFQVHGFASQAYILTDDNNFFGNSKIKDGGSFAFRELGLNASWRLHHRFQLSAQGLSRWAGEGDQGEFRLDYGYADAIVVSNLSNVLGFRAGRVLTPFGLYNQTRDVASTRPSILLPQSIYFDRTRDLAISGDGATLYGEQRTNLGNFFIEAEYGLPRELNAEAEYALLGRKVPGHLEPDFSYMFRILYEKDEGAYRTAITAGEIHIDYEPESTGDPILPGSFRFRPVILSLQMNRERLSLTGEYALRFFRTDGFASDTKLTGESYYLQAAYRFAQGWEAMARYDVLYSDRSDRDGKDFEAQTRGTVPAHTRFAKDFTVGLRWDITPHWMARVEYHLVDGTAWLPRLDNRDTADLERYWNLFSALVSFHF
jgi:hypothetical protein